MMMRLGVLFLGRKRPGFDPDWGRQMERAARAALAETGYPLFAPEGVIPDEGSLRRALDACRNAGVDVLIALQTTMSDGRMAPTLAQQWDGPVVLWATPENQAGERVSACSLVGTHLFAATIRQLGGRFELVYGMPGEPDTRRQLESAVRIAHACRRLPRTRLGLVNYHAPGFIDMHADPAALASTLGVSMRHFGLEELLAAMRAQPETAISDDVERVLQLGLPLHEVVREDLIMNSRYYLGLKNLISEEHLDAIALRDWPELPDVVGQWPHLAVVRLLGEGVPVACEGDVDGTLSCLIGELLGLGPTGLSDWLEHDRESITLWHAGDAPFALCEPIGEPGGPRLSRHFNNRKPLVVDAALRAGRPLTIFRVWRCDGEYRAMAFEAETLPPRRPLLGTNGLARVADRDVCEWFESLCQEGMPHHVALFAGHHAALLRRFARRVGLKWVEGS